MVLKSALLVASLLLSATAATAEPKVLPLEPLRERLRTIEVEINGQTGRFMLDTGGGLTTVTPAFADRIGCTPWGRTSGPNMFGEILDLQRCDGIVIHSGGVELGSTTVGVFDPTHLLEPGQPAPEGSLALDVFKDRVVTLDVAGNRLILEDAESFARRIDGAVELPMRTSREVFAFDAYIGVDAPLGRLWFILDSGAGGVILVARDNAEAFGLDPAAEGPQSLKFDLAPGLPVEGLAVTPAMMLQGNLGMPFMKDYVLTMDFANQRLWVRRVEQPT